MNTTTNITEAKTLLTACRELGKATGHQDPEVLALLDSFKVGDWTLTADPCQTHNDDGVYVHNAKTGAGHAFLKRANAIFFLADQV